ncbi:MAG: hypothetical protein JSR82_10200 [Verrucomicrobia bacterium]|nr:hypothetical protein [Verrucomicrobiota bacterium]
MKLAHILNGRPVPQGHLMVSAIGCLKLRDNSTDHLIEVFLTSPAGFLATRFEKISVPVAALGAFRIGSLWVEGEYRGQRHLSNQRTITLTGSSKIVRADDKGISRLLLRHHLLPKEVYRGGWFSTVEGILDGKPVQVVAACPTLLTSLYAPSPEVLMALFSRIDGLPWARRFWLENELFGPRRSEFKDGVLRLCLSKWVDSEGCRPLVWWFLEKKAREAAMEIERSVSRQAGATNIEAPAGKTESHLKVRLPFSRPCTIKCRGQMEADRFLVQAIDSCDYQPEGLRRLELERENPGASPESIYDYIEHLRSGRNPPLFGSTSNTGARLGDQPPRKWQLPTEWRLPGATELLPGLEIEWPKRRPRANAEPPARPRPDVSLQDQVGIGAASSGMDAVPPLKLQFTLPQGLDDELTTIGNMEGFTFFVGVLAELGTLGFQVSRPDCGYLGELSRPQESDDADLPTVLVAQVQRGEVLGFVCEVKHPKKLVRARTASIAALRVDAGAATGELVQLLQEAGFRAQIVGAAGGKRWKIRTVRHLFKPLQADPQFKAVRIHALKLERAFKQLLQQPPEAAG